jgi:hypothetical protein
MPGKVHEGPAFWIWYYAALVPAVALGQICQRLTNWSWTLARWSAPADSRRFLDALEECTERELADELMLAAHRKRHGRP